MLVNRILLRHNNRIKPAPIEFRDRGIFEQDRSASMEDRIRGAFR